jgi:hypothetical protein
MDEFFARLAVELKNTTDPYKEIVHELMTYVNTYSEDEWPEGSDVSEHIGFITKRHLAGTPDAWLGDLHGADPSRFVDTYRINAQAEPPGLDQEDMCPNKACRSFKSFWWDDTSDRKRCNECGTEWG